MSMTSRQRVAAALDHLEPDRVPVDLNPCLEFYERLKDFLGLDFEETLSPNSAMEVIPDPRVPAALGVDLVAVKLGSPMRSPTSSSGSGQDEWGVVRRRVFNSTGGSYMEAVHHPLAEATTRDLNHYPWPEPSVPGRGEGAELSARRIYENTDLALVGRFGPSIIETALNLLGWENWMIRLAADPEFAGALIDRIVDVAIALDRIGLEATAPYLQIFKVSGEDLGTQRGLLFSPETVRQILLPRMGRRWSAAREYLDGVNPSVKIMLHSCGAIRPVIGDLIEAGIEVLDPIQPAAAGMDSVELKQEFGNRLTFHGGVDIQHVLPFGTTEEVQEEVRRRIEALAPGGGYILAPSHAVQSDVPPQNIVTMCRTVQSIGRCGGTRYVG